MRRAAWSLVALVVLVGAMFLFVFPTRTYLSQRQSLAATRQRVHVLSIQNKELAARVQKLNTDAEIERLAREQYSLVRPGEEAYAILPAPQPTPPPQSAPAAKARHHRGVFATIRSWFSG
jgi:cell division protein FtsB